MCFKIRKLYLSDEPRGDGMDDAENFNTDVIAIVEEGEIDQRTVKYVASFFTYANIFELQSQHMKTGEFLNGKYFFSKNMLLIDNCSMENVLRVVHELLEEGTFKEVFRRI